VKANRPLSSARVLTTGIFKISVEMLLNEMRNDFGIGFRRKSVPFLGELSLQGQIVFNDAVMRNNDAALAVAVRMRIFFGRTPVCRPTRVTEAELPVIGCFVRSSSRFFSLPEDRRI